MNMLRSSCMNEITYPTLLETTERNIGMELIVGIDLK